METKYTIEDAKRRIESFFELIGWRGTAYNVRVGLPAVRPRQQFIRYQVALREAYGIMASRPESYPVEWLDLARQFKDVAEYLEI